MFFNWNLYFCGECIEGVRVQLLQTSQTLGERERQKEKERLSRRVRRREQRESGRGEQSWWWAESCTCIVSGKNSFLRRRRSHRASDELKSCSVFVRAASRSHTLTLFSPVHDFWLLLALRDTHFFAHLFFRFTCTSFWEKLYHLCSQHIRCSVEKRIRDEQQLRTCNKKF